MGLFNRKKEEPSQPNREIAERGRDYAIAKRHGDRRAMNKIVRQMENDGLASADWDSFKAGQSEYDDIPPIPKTRRNRRR
ncbi:hypothetical protein [Streptomyces sp. NBC_00690]|uniref:hypothetical protein n=1 Tax=Streptomyces sp. NBC_00690 TaxID=2975808 RepID=UPI002E2D2FD0|nr:hypothetical protein [Streptomyces sp. NBC_00690]